MLGIVCLLVNSWDFRNSWMISCVFYIFHSDALLLCRNNLSVEWAVTIIAEILLCTTVVIRNLIKKIQGTVLAIVCFANILLDTAHSFPLLGESVDLSTFKMPLAILLRLLKLCFGCYIYLLQGKCLHTMRHHLSFPFTAGKRSWRSRQASVLSCTRIYF